MKVGKPQSKRVPVRLRQKIQKASASKQRKQRKEAKKDPQWRSRLKKDPGIPNLFPYKAKLLADIEEGQRKKVEEAQKRRETAKAQRQGTAVAEAATSASALAEEDEDEDLTDHEEESDDEMEEQDESHPMAALLASAQARARAFAPEEGDDDNGGDDDGDEVDEWNGIDDSNTDPTPAQHTRKVLPKQALADPIKAVSALLDRMQRTTDGIQRLIDHYQIPPLVAARSELTSRFLVDVARKRGRLGRGGIPNLHSAALVVLADLNEERLVLPAAVPAAEVTVAATRAQGGLRIVSQMVEPFRIEGLFGDDAGGKEVMIGEAMAVE